MKNTQTHVAYGLVTGIVMVILGVTMYFTGIAFVKGMQYVAFAPLLIGIILNALAYSKANDGYVTFGNVFGSCFKLSMIVGIIMVVWGFASIYLFPEMKEKGMEIARQEMAKNPQMTEELMETSLGIAKKYYNVIMIATSIFGALFYGAIFGLIGAAIAKKKGERPVVTGDNF